MSSRSLPRLAALALVALATILLGSALPAGAAAARGEAATEPAPLLERVEVNVVNVDVTVTDRDGRPVRDLSREDFVLFEDGKPQQIENFYLIERYGVRADPTSPPEPIGAGSPFRRRVILLIDNNTVERVARDRAIQAAREFLAERFANEHEWAVLAVGDTVQVVQPLTNERFLVQSALDRVARMPTNEERYVASRQLMSDPTRGQLATLRMKEESAGIGSIAGIELGTTLRAESRFNAYRNFVAARRTAEAMLRTFRAYGAMDGQKVLVMVTGGIEVNPEYGSPMGGAAGGLSDSPSSSRDPHLYQTFHALRTLIGEVARAANAAQFRIYSLKASGLESRAPQHDVAQRYSGASDNMAVYSSPVEVDDDDSAQLQLAGATGGLALTGNDPGGALDRLHDDLSFYYSLGYSPGHVGDGRYHKIEVRSRREGLRVRARQGYVDLTDRQRLEIALASPLEFEKEKGSLPVAARLDDGLPVARGREPGGVTAVATVPMETLTFVDSGERVIGRVHVYLTLYDAEGQPVDQVRRTRDLSFPRAMRGEVLAEDLAYSLRFTPPTRGRFTVALTVLDDVSGDSGTAFASLER